MKKNLSQLRNEKMVDLCLLQNLFFVSFSVKNSREIYNPHGYRLQQIEKLL